MSNCKTCSNYVANDEKPNGLCIMFDDEKLIKSDSAMFDNGKKQNLLSASVAVGENFGCIHYITSLF